MRWLAAIIVCAAVLFAAGLRFAPAVLQEESASARGDCLVVLGGENWLRVPLTRKLYESGVAPTVLITGKGDCGQNKLWLLEGGVPRSAILMECDSVSTAENARLSTPILRSHGCTNVVLVTSWYHARRALNCFRHYAPEIQFTCRTTEVKWRGWPDRYDRKRILQEYVKLAGYWLRYGIPPW